MITKQQHLIDCHARLKAVFDAQVPPVRCDRNRAYEIAAERLPLVTVYATDESADQIGGEVPSFWHRVTLQVEIRVALTDAWDAAADALAQTGLNALYADAAWLKRWKHPPGFRARQFVDDRAAVPMGGVVLSIEAEPRAALDFTLVPGTVIGGIDVDIDVADPLKPGTPDGAPEAQMQLDTPPE